MNDFTKEELQELYFIITGQKGQLSCENLACLGNKLKYMIEDYCEHEKGGIEHIEIMDICNKCGKPW